MPLLATLHTTEIQPPSAPRPVAKRPTTLTSEVCPTNNPTSLLIKLRFSQISIIFESVAGGKTLPALTTPTFRAKKAICFASFRDLLPLNGSRGYGVSMNTTPWRDAVGWCRRNRWWGDVKASTYLARLVWESTTPQNGLMRLFWSAEACGE